MTGLDPCLIGCDSALAEADLLLVMLGNSPAALDPELAAVRLRIARLRREVDRLRGMPIEPDRRTLQPDWSGSTAIGSPWPPSASGSPAKF